ncbi:LysR substrate-binding domain-containing protein [Variovorax sp. KK3]|uniref:LysR substrate-binding domain-containing protein n=1 Tax=Variovorax sp. KK3 TaxID=1855728 RepID=UPI002118F3C6|nr:LysR substrate-binding domain-containing protein [Variovorax sp. KK3]
MAARSEAFLRGVQLRHLRCLVAVAQERHLARAAERLALSQPAVSKTLAELETLAGARLVDRGSAGRRGIQGFTVAGEQLLAHALRVLEALDAGAEDLMPASGARLQRLRIGALPSVAPSLLPPALAALRERLPELQVQVHTGANAFLLDALRAGELDLVAGRMSDPQLMAGLTFELLYTEPLALVARAGHALSKAAPSVQDVLRHPMVVYGEGTIPRHHTESFLSGLGLRLPAHTTQTLDLSVARALVVRSDAVWFTPIGAAHDDLASGLLTRLAVDTTGTEEPVGLLLRSDAEPSPARQALISLLRDNSVGRGADQSRVARR